MEMLAAAVLSFADNDLFIWFVAPFRFSFSVEAVAAPLGVVAKLYVLPVFVPEILSVFI